MKKHSQNNAPLLDGVLAASRQHERLRAKLHTIREVLPMKKSSQRPDSPAPVSNRQVKSSAFTVLFGDSKNAAQLFTALDGRAVSPEEIHFTTLEGVLFIARKNDMAFTVKNRVLIISEHQSTLNENIPLRSIIYYGRTMEKLIDKRSLYRNRLFPIPTPEFYTFYNGSSPFPSEKILKLSDAYLEKSHIPMLELSVKVININLPENHSILGKCRPLYEYSWFIQRIKDYLIQDLERDDAIVHAIKDCEQEGILADFVREHGSEVLNMLFTEFNMDDALKVRYEEGFEEGEEKGIEKGLQKGESLRLIKMVCKKLEKGKNPWIIAQELDEERDVIDRICAEAEENGMNTDKIYTALQNN